MDQTQQEVTVVQGRERAQLLALLEDEQKRSGYVSEKFLDEVALPVPLETLWQQRVEHAL